jgi:hypothetical protein
VFRITLFGQQNGGHRDLGLPVQVGAAIQQLSGPHPLRDYAEKSQLNAARTQQIPGACVLIARRRLIEQVLPGILQRLATAKLLMGHACRPFSCSHVFVHRQPFFRDGRQARRPPRQVDTADTTVATRERLFAKRPAMRIAHHACRSSPSPARACGAVRARRQSALTRPPPRLNPLRSGWTTLWSLSNGQSRLRASRLVVESLWNGRIDCAPRRLPGFRLLDRSMKYCASFIACLRSSPACR